jgi:hypothetical protein
LWDPNYFNDWKHFPEPLGRHEKSVSLMKCYKSWVHLVSSLKNVTKIDLFHGRLIKVKMKAMAGNYRANNSHYSVFSQVGFSC